MIGWIAIAWRDEKDAPHADTIQIELADLTRDIAHLFQVLI